jgi:hypothetical protein
MKKLTPYLSILILAIIAATADAATYPIAPLPDWPESSWNAGGSITHHISVQHGEDSIGLDLRVAILGTESAEDQTLYWIEFDFTDMTGVPRDAQLFFYQNYGELPNAIRFKALIPYYEFMLALTDPSKVYHDFTDPGFIRALVFQYNRQVPLDVDPALIGGFILPLVASEVMGDVPEDFVSARNLGVHTIEDPASFATELSQSEITVEAGTFLGSLFSFTANDSSGTAGTVFFTPANPVLPFVAFMMNWTSGAGPGAAESELVAVRQSGATSQIVGNPVRFDLQTLMYGN